MRLANLRWMKSRGIIDLAVLLLFVFADSSGFASGRSWRQLSVGPYELYSLQSDVATRDIAHQLDAFEKTVGELLKTEDRLPDYPTAIYVLDAEQFRRFNQLGGSIAGFFKPLSYENVVVLNGDQPLKFVEVTIFHEFTHYIERNQGSIRFPPWYVEGYAELFSVFRINNNRIVVGDAPPPGLLIDTDAKYWIPMRRLLAVNMSDPEYRSEHLQPQFYAESWALVHMLLFDDADLLRRTNTYLDNLALDVDEDQAFKTSFQISKDELDKRLLEWIRNRRMTYRAVMFKQGVQIDDAPIKTMTPADVAYHCARLAYLLDLSLIHI